MTRRTLADRLDDMVAIVESAPHKLWTLDELAAAMDLDRTEGFDNLVGKARHAVAERGGNLGRCYRDRSTGRMVFRYMPLGDERMHGRPGFDRQTKEWRARGRNVGETAEYMAKNAVTPWDRFSAEARLRAVQAVEGILDAADAMEAAIARPRGWEPPK